MNKITKNNEEKLEISQSEYDELIYRRSKDVSIEIQYGSSGQTSYLFGRCPICGGAEKYIELIKERYCSCCGQKLSFLPIMKGRNITYKKYCFSYIVRALKDIETKIVVSTSLREAVLEFYDTYSNRFDIIDVKLIVE